MGYGLYFAEHRAGGAYFAKYLKQESCETYLYEVEINVLESEVVDLDKMPDDEVRIRTGMTYAQLRSAHAGASIVPILHQHGIHMLSCYEGTKPNHGLSYLCVSPSRIEIVQILKYFAN